MEELNPFLLGAILLVGLLIFVFGIWGTIMQWSVFFRYNANNHRHIQNGRTARSVAEEMLAKLGYNDISVRRTSYLWLIFFYKWGNRYSPKRKTIFLYGNILNKNTVTAVAIATQKVGLVIQHKNREKKMEFRAKWEIWTRMAPNLFLPIITIGIIIDFIINIQFGLVFGIITLNFVGLAILWTCIAFYALYLCIPTERRAGQLALEAVKKYNLIPMEFIPNVEKLYDAQVKVYIADFILAILNLILDILYVVAKSRYLKRR